MLALADGLKEKEWKVYIAAPEKGDLAKRALACGIAICHFKPRQDYDIFSARKIAKFVDENKIEVMHAHHPRAHAVALIAKYFTKTNPVLVVSRRVTHPMRNNIFSKLKYHNNKIDGYAVVAQAVKNILANYKIPEEKLRIIYSGVDTSVFHPQPKNQKIAAELSLPENIPVVGLIGNFSRDKGQHILLKAAHELFKQNKKAIYLFAGRDTASDSIKQTASQLNIPEEYLRFMGFRKDVADILSAVDISVNCAIAGEALSGSIRESLAMQKPVIASDIGGNREIVQNNVTGKLFKAGDDKELASLLQQALDNPSDLKTMAENGLRFVQNNLTTQKTIENSEQFYLDLLAKKKTSR